MMRRGWRWPEREPPRRAADLVRGGDPGGCRLGLVGFADDTGVLLNGGRPGAGDGPAAFRAALARYGAARPEGVRWPRTYDVGDVGPGGTLAETHERATGAVAELMEAGLLPVGIGGGHDFTYSFVRALARGAERPLTGIYLDAHLDVREDEGSGMSFRRLLEEGHAEELHVRGLDPFSNSEEHLAWFREHGGATEGFGPRDPWPAGPLFVSVDLDVLDQAHAPGVSAMNPAGWTPPEAEAWVRAAGSHPGVLGIDFMELSPRWDEGGRTARLAARLFLAFLRGVAERDG